jgi:hypothetical protein
MFTALVQGITIDSSFCQVILVGVYWFRQKLPKDWCFSNLVNLQLPYKVDHGKIKTQG